ncbi:unnamed protein product, partial [Dovyalis caffra]
AALADVDGEKLPRSRDSFSPPPPPPPTNPPPHHAASGITIKALGGDRGLFPLDDEAHDTTSNKP